MYKTGAWGKQARERSRHRTSYWSEYNRNHTPQHNKKMITYLDKVRAKVLKHLGDKCIRCGFDDSRALQIDHINGGGRKEMKERKMNRYSFLKDVLADETGKYQLLCANCNWIKREENREEAFKK